MTVRSIFYFIKGSTVSADAGDNTFAKNGISAVLFSGNCHSLSALGVFGDITERFETAEHFHCGCRYRSSLRHTVI
jgi:hypothetical protein